MRRDPVLPPGFSLVSLRESSDAMRHAVAIAGEAGAATLVWTRRFDVVEFALVLEPEEPLKTARLAHYLCMNALADALSVHCPPERPVLFRWPATLMFDHGLIGGGRLAWPEGCGEEETPGWLVFGAMVRAALMVPLEERGAFLGVAMDEEGFEEVDAVDLVESFLRHLMHGVSRWQEQGPKAAVQRWLDRLEPEAGTRRSIGPDGDLTLTRNGVPQRHSLVEALREVAWLDPETGAPRA